jgi:hypothetical protein
MVSAAIELADRARLDLLRHGGRLRLQQRRGSGHLHFRRLAADFELDVLQNLGADGGHQFGNHRCLEAGLADRYLIGRGDEVGHRVTAVGAGGGDARGVGAGIGNRHGGPRDGGTGRVSHLAADRSGRGALAQQGKGQGHTHQRHTKMAAAENSDPSHTTVLLGPAGQLGQPMSGLA